MARYIVRRILTTIPLLFVISILAFLLYRIVPNTPFRVELANNPQATEADIQRLEQKYGLDRPLYVQYADWMVHVLQGDFGRSYFTKRPVMDMIKERLPNTLILTGSAFLLSFIVGVPLGIWSGLHRNSWGDNVVRVMTVLLTSVPAWAVGLIAIIVLGGQLRWFPQGGMFSVGQETNILDRLHHLILPAVVAGLSGCIGYVRLMRSQTLEILREDYIRTAHAKGLPFNAVIYRHLLRNAIIPVWTGFGGLLAALIGGAAIYETVFSWPGMGLLVLDSLFKLDYPVVLAATMIGAVLIALGYLIVDIGYVWLDPRVRL